MLYMTICYICIQEVCFRCCTSSKCNGWNTKDDLLDECDPDDKECAGSAILPSLLMILLTSILATLRLN